MIDTLLTLAVGIAIIFATYALLRPPAKATVRADINTGLKDLLMAIDPNFQAQFDRLDQAASALDTYVAGKVEAAVSAATAELTANHADELSALTAKVAELTQKLAA